MLSREQIHALPKVILHDHLDGDLRPQTIIEIANEIGYAELPTTDVAELTKWFVDSCSAGSLEKYLRTFDHTIAVMQTREHIARVSRECVLDLALDNVIYAEIRVAPEHFTKRGLSLDDVVAAMIAGYNEGVAEAEVMGKKIVVGTILCAMRHNDRSMEIAELAIRWREDGVVGFDIAGAEKGFPASNHKAAFDYLRREGLPFTIHAGEADGVASIQDALENCHAARIGHGVRLADEIRGDELTPFAREVRERGVHLEMAPTSNIQNGVVSDYASHPISAMKKLGFNVGINTDNRLMSGTSASKESFEIARAHNWGLVDFKEVAESAARAAFATDLTRSQILNEISAYYAHLS